MREWLRPCITWPEREGLQASYVYVSGVKAQVLCLKIGTLWDTCILTFWRLSGWCSSRLLYVVCAGVSAARGAGHIPAVAHAHSSQLSGAIQRHGLHQNVGETSPPGCTFAYHVNLATYSTFLYICTFYTRSSWGPKWLCIAGKCVGKWTLGSIKVATFIPASVTETVVFVQAQLCW